MSAETTNKIGLSIPDFGEAGWDILVSRNFRKLDSLLGTCPFELSGGTVNLTTDQACFGGYKFTGPATGPSFVHFPIMQRTVFFHNDTGFDVYVGFVGEEQKDMIRVPTDSTTVAMFSGSNKCELSAGSGGAFEPKTVSQLGMTLFHSVSGQTYLRNIQGGNGICIEDEDTNIKVMFDTSKLTQSGCAALKAKMGINSQTQGNNQIATHQGDTNPGYLASKLQFAAPLVGRPVSNSLGGNKFSYSYNVALDCKLIPSGQGPTDFLLGCRNGQLCQVKPEDVLENWDIILPAGCGYDLGQGVVQQKISFTDLAEGTYVFDWPVALTSIPSVWEQSNTDTETVVQIDAVTEGSVQISVISLSGTTVSGCLFGIGEAA